MATFENTLVQSVAYLSVVFILEARKQVRNLIFCLDFFLLFIGWGQVAFFLQSLETCCICITCAVQPECVVVPLHTPSPSVDIQVYNLRCCQIDMYTTNIVSICSQSCLCMANTSCVHMDGITYAAIPL